MSDADWHLDHVYPLALGGTHEDDNLEAACVYCNLSKGALVLEDFIGPEEAKRWREAGWPPPFERLSEKPVDELWAMSRRAARRFARSPREVPFRQARWGTSDGRDVEIAHFLRGRPDPWRAVPVAELWEPLGFSGESPLHQQWQVAWGLGGSPKRPQDEDVRNPVSRYITPTRAPVEGRLVGRPAFRLQFDDPGPARILDEFRELKYREDP